VAGHCPTKQYLATLRDFCTRAGAVLISDEVISFRIGYHGAQGEFGFQADLVTLGKIIGGGFPVGAVCGGKALMSVFDPTHGKPAAPHGGTFNANPVSMSAGAAAMRLLTPTALQDLDELGRMAREQMQAALHEAGVPWRATGQASLFRFVAGEQDLVGNRSTWLDASTTDQLERFTAALLNHGILVDHGGLGCLSTVMTEADVAALGDPVPAALRDFDAARSEQLAKIDAVESAAWAGWVKSQEPAETLQAETFGDRQRARKTSKGQAGDPRFLATVLACVERRCAVLGLDAERRLGGGPGLRLHEHRNRGNAVGEHQVVDRLFRAGQHLRRAHRHAETRGQTQRVPGEGCGHGRHHLR